VEAETRLEVIGGKGGHEAEKNMTIEPFVLGVETREEHLALDMDMIILLVLIDGHGTEVQVV
jgi:hypothetical protein